MSITFKGIVPALITPMSENEEVNEAGLCTCRSTTVAVRS